MMWHYNPAGVGILQAISSRGLEGVVLHYFTGRMADRSAGEMKTFFYLTLRLGDGEIVYATRSESEEEVRGILTRAKSLFEDAVDDPELEREAPRLSMEESVKA